MDGKWVCLAISSAFHHGDKESAAREVESIFGESLIEVRIVCDEFMEQSGEYFVFVKCSDYHSHIDRLKDSPAILRVVQSYNEPAFLSEAEVHEFSASVEEEPPPVELMYGDIVQVGEEVIPKKYAHLSGLYGLVTEPNRANNRVSVFFRLETRCFIVVISSTSLKFIGNVIQQMTVSPFSGPMSRESLFKGANRRKAKEAVEYIVSRDKIRRKQRRTHEGSYGG